MSDKRHSTLRPAGTIIVMEADGPLTQIDTLQCCHCGGHWHVNPGSGKRRGYCTRCAAVTCGRECCDACVPFEQRLENSEAGRPWWDTFRPTTASVPRVLTG